MLGAGALSIDVGFDRKTGKLVDGRFDIDMTGMDLRVQDDLFPIASSIISIDWEPAEARFTMAEAGLPHRQYQRQGERRLRARPRRELGTDGRHVDEHARRLDRLQRTAGSALHDDGVLRLVGAALRRDGHRKLRRRKAGRAARRDRPRRHAARRHGLRHGRSAARGSPPTTSSASGRTSCPASARDWFVKNIPTGEIIIIDHEVQLPGRHARHGRRGAKAAPAQLDVDRHAGQGRRHLADGGHGADHARGPDPADHARRRPHDLGDGRDLSDAQRATSASPTPRSRCRTATRRASR